MARAVGDYEAITRFMAHRHMCLGCVAAGLDRDRLYVEALLVDLVRQNRAGTTPGRCRACRSADIVFYVPSHLQSAPRPFA
jgi:hypothetical protein